MKKELDSKIIEINEEVQIGNIILEKGDKIEVLKENKSFEVSQEEWLEKVEGYFDYATLFTTDVISRTGFKSGEIKKLYGGIYLKSNDTLLEMSFTNDMKYTIDHLSQAKKEYHLFNPSSSWLLVVGKMSR